MNGEEEFFDAVTGFDSDNSSGEFSEANQKVTGMIDLDTSKNNRIGKTGESLWLLLLFRLWLPSGRGPANHLIHSWEKRMN
ncbi:oxysterol binding protein like 2 [Homo sapiens]|uniref:Oxysterol binding protein like 2 n=1 Tax=Homo sapiens TaxID=9606 RepID=A0A2R8Y5B9_HUMAN|nr:oxysterol binding protein like 2 [Homo sapiens]KAI4006262.1 oxysterol binding protein like 2 [Homo sapiens]